jgi:hypothetical protein
MTTLATNLQREHTLLLVDFKWLMAGMGWWVDLDRWRRDECYARQCLANALTCNNASLHLRAQEIDRQLCASAWPWPAIA